jgi:hypothetical protein
VCLVEVKVRPTRVRVLASCNPSPLVVICCQSAPHSGATGQLVVTADLLARAASSTCACTRAQGD